MYKIRVLSKKAYKGHYFADEFDLYTNEKLSVVESKLDEIHRGRYPEDYEKLIARILKVETVEGEIL